MKVTQTTIHGIATQFTDAAEANDIMDMDFTSGSREDLTVEEAIEMVDQYEEFMEIEAHRQFQKAVLKLFNYFSFSGRIPGNSGNL